MRHLYWLLLPVLSLLCCAGCPSRNISRFSGDDKVMLQRVQDIGIAINKYFATNAEWPQTLLEASSILPPGTSWPNNPYTNTPITDTGSPTFDPQKSVGMVCYEKIVRDDQITNFVLHVFGRTGELVALTSRDFQEKTGP